MSDIRHHIQLLLDLSNTTEEWALSSWSQSIGFVDRATLRQLRQYWAQYVAQGGWPQARTAIAKRSKDVGNMNMTTGVRTAGPFWYHAPETMGHCYRRYWETGVAGGNTEDLSRLKGDGNHNVNPMFAVSSAASGDFAVHYGSDPLLGFHLAEAFQEKTSKTKGAVSEQADRVVRLAKSQFTAWCETFKKYFDKGRIHIDFFDGDALALSHELQLELTLDKKPIGVARTYTKPWHACPLVLDGLVSPEGDAKRAYGLFDVVDTSNVGDHVGFINILSATAPLLRRNASSVLYTESLLIAAEDIQASLSTILGSDVATFSLLLGLVPSGLLTGVTMDAVANESALFHFMQDEKSFAKQYRMRVSWKIPELGDPAVVKVLESGAQSQLQVRYEAQDLAGYLFDLYKKMFAHEDVTQMMSRMARMRKGSYSVDQERYTRAGMVALLRLVKVRVQVDWERTMRLFDEHLNADKSLIVGSNSLQELYMHLYLYDVWTTEVLQGHPLQLRAQLGLPLRSSSEEKDILGDQTIPPIVHIVLVVPRHKLKIFTSDPEQIGTPALHISITQTRGKPRDQYENCFHSFHLVFGKIVYNDDDKNVSIVEEDDHGWRGSEDLVVCCAVPAFGLLIGPRDGIRAALMINTTPGNLQRFQRLGLRMAVFETGLEDKSRFFICRDAPKLDTTHFPYMQRDWIEASQSRNKSSIQTLVKLDSGHKATHLQNRIDFAKGSLESKALSEGAAVTVSANTASSLLVHIGKSLQRTIAFPFPIQGSRPKIRIARKSFWIEVEVPIFTVLDGDRFDSWTQMIIEAKRPPICWTIPRINLEMQPPIKLAKKGDSSWLQLFMGTALSHAERLLNAPDEASTGNPKLDFKQSLNVLLANFTGANPKANGPVKTIQLCVKPNGCHTLVFAVGLRHDLELGSVVMEAYVVPLTIPRVKELYAAICQLQRTTPAGINLTNEESTLWKRMLPALAERCRTWKHRSTCEYKLKGTPLSTEEGETPLCSCGMGKISGSELGELGVKEAAPFAKYATRIAIAPIFPVPYVESSMSEFKNGGLRATAKASAAGALSALAQSNSSASGSKAKRCDNCGNEEGPFRACSRCGKVRYCGPACQKAAWKGHKKDCERD